MNNNTLWKMVNCLTFIVCLFLGCHWLYLEPRTDAALLQSVTFASSAMPESIQIWKTDAKQAKLLVREEPIEFYPAIQSNVLSIRINENDPGGQEIEGFGAAMTDASAWLIWKKLHQNDRDELMEKLFTIKACDVGESCDSLGLNYVRVPMGASDFARERYTYDDLEPGQKDPTLAQFNIDHDEKYIIPALQAAKNLASGKLYLMATPWTAPAWMKYPAELNKGRLLSQYYEVYANYFIRFIEHYEDVGLSINAITIQNEPEYPHENMPKMNMYDYEQAEFIRILGPLLRHKAPNTRILIWDHNWDNPNYPLNVLNSLGKDSEYVDGVAWHCYSDPPKPENISRVTIRPAYFTECSGHRDGYGVFSDYDFMWAVKYVLIRTLRHGAKTVLYWNLALDKEHGPRNGGCSNCNGLVTIDSNSGTIFDEETEFYALGHFSQFVQRGARKIETTSHPEQIETVAFKNPDNSIILVALNSSTSQREFAVYWQNKMFKYVLPRYAAVTFKWQGNSSIIPDPDSPNYLLPIGNVPPDAVPACNKSLPGVILFSELSYSDTGTCSHLTADHPNLAQLAVGDNTVSSIWINGNYQVKLYRDANYGGDGYEEVNESTSDLDVRSLGGQYSSIKIIDKDKASNCPDDERVGVYFYGDANYEGACHYSTGDIADFGDTFVGNNNVSSLRIHGDYEVKLYTSQDFRGDDYFTYTSQTNLDDNSKISNNASSARMRRRPKPIDIPANLSGLVENVAYHGQDSPSLRRCVVGSHIYVDREEHIIRGFSNPQLDNLGCILIANDDKENTTESLLEFDLKQAARLYVHVQYRVDQDPGWMAGLFARTSDEVETTGDSTQRFLVYACDSRPGHIRLGGLRHGGGRGAKANYWVSLAPIDSASANKVCSTDPAPPPCPPPALLQPQNTDIARQRTLTFQWGAVACETKDTTSYLLRIATAPDMSGGEIVTETVVGGTQATLAFAPLWDHRDLYWSVQVANAASSAQWATVRQFRVEANDPPTIALNQANDQAITTNDQQVWGATTTWQFSGTAGDPDGTVQRVEANCFGQSCNGLHLGVTGTEAWRWTRDNLPGHHDVYFQAIDDDGATSPATDRHRIELWVDQVPPETGVVLNNQANPARWPQWFTEPVLARLVATDYGSGQGVNYARAGVQEIRYRIDGGAWQTEPGDQVYISLGNDGQHTLEYYAVDNVGNAETTRRLPIRVDLTPATPPFQVTVGGVTDGEWQNRINAPLFAWQPPTDGANGSSIWGYQFYFGADPAGVAYNTVLGNQTQWLPPVNGLRTGTYYLRGRTRDQAGLWSDWATLFVFRFDNTPPPPPLNVRHNGSVPNGVTQNLSSIADFTWDAPADLGAGFAGVNVYWGNDATGGDENAPLLAANHFQAASPFCAGQSRCTGYLRLRSVDQVGNKSAWITVFTLVYDSAPQSGGEKAHSARYRLVSDAFPAGSGQQASTRYQAHSLLGQPIDSGQTSSTRYKVVSGFEAASLQAPATCAAPPLALNQGAASTNLALVTVALCWSGAVEMQLSHTPTFLGAVWQPFTATLSWYLQPVTQQQAQQLAVYARFRRLDGTVSDIFADDILFVSPEAAALGFSLNIGDSIPPALLAATSVQAAAQAGATVELPIVGAEGATLFAVFDRDNGIITEIRLGEGADLSNAPWQPFTPDLVYLPAGGDGEQTVYAQVRDAAGNQSPVSSQRFLFDTTPPQGGIAFAQHVVGPAQESVQVFFTAEDNLTGIADMRVSADPFFAGAVWRPYTSTLAIPAYLPAAGELTLYVQYRDRAGNSSDVYSDSYRVDVEPPQVLVQVASGAGMLRTVDIRAFDTLSIPAKLYVSNDSRMADQVQTLAYVDQIPWTFDAQGVVWVQVEDSVGNVSEVTPAYADTVTASSSTIFLPVIYR